MRSEHLVVALGARRYRVERPWPPLPQPRGKVTDVAVGPNGGVYVLTRCDPSAEARVAPVNAFSPEGDSLRRFGADRIFDAHMIAASPDGLIWVVDRDAHEIVAFTPDGREARTLGRRHHPLEPFNHPSAIAFGPDGGIVVADGYAGGRIHRLDAAGKPIISWGKVGRERGEFLTAHGLWVLGDGRVAVADRENHRVQIFSPEGALLDVLDCFFRPSDLWADADGRLYVVDATPTLTCIGPDGSVAGRCRPVLNGAHGLCGTPGGDIFLAEGNPSRVTRLVLQS